MNRECMLCDRSIPVHYQACKKCREEHGLEGEYTTWPEWAKEMVKSADKLHRLGLKEPTIQDLAPGFDGTDEELVDWFRRDDYNEWTVKRDELSLEEVLVSYNITLEEYKLVTAPHGMVAAMADQAGINKGSLRSKKARILKRLQKEHGNG